MTDDIQVNILGETVRMNWTPLKKRPDDGTVIEPLPDSGGFIMGKNALYDEIDRLQEENERLKRSERREVGNVDPYWVFENYEDAAVEIQRLEEENETLKHKMNTKYWDKIRDDNIRLKAEAVRLRAENARLKAAYQQAIKDEPELPGEMPDKLKNALHVALCENDMSLIAECLRITVRLTKQGILDRIKRLEETP